MKTFLIAMIVFMTLLSTSSTSTPVASGTGCRKQDTLMLMIWQFFFSFIRGRNSRLDTGHFVASTN